MDPTITAALITVAAGAAGAVGRGIVLISKGRVSAKSEVHDLCGPWISEWGPYPDGPVRHKEFIEITKHNGKIITGYVVSEQQSEKGHRWTVEGRFMKDRFLQLIYFPAPNSTNLHFLSYGCYFFELAADGKSFWGYSTGFGTAEDNRAIQKTQVAFHTLKRGPSRRSDA